MGAVLVFVGVVVGVVVGMVVGMIVGVTVGEGLCVGVPSNTIFITAAVNGCIWKEYVLPADENVELTEVSVNFPREKPSVAFWNVMPVYKGYEKKRL